MIADFEKLAYSGEMLSIAWDDVFKIYKQLEHSNFTTVELLELITWIKSTSLSKFLFPGMSLGRLLISKPDKQGKLNYQQTLTIAYNPKSDNYDFTYSDWDIINTKSEYQKAIIWRLACKRDHLITGMETFLEWKPEWNNMKFPLSSK